MKIYIIRHGETTGDLEDRFGGDYEDYLSPEGEKQAARLAKKLQGKNIEMIFHSPRIRATQTARVVSEKNNIPMKKVEDFRERNSYGVLTGMVKDEAKEKYPKEFAKIQKSKLYHDVLDSEDYESFKQRVLNVWDQLVSNDKYKTVALISHGGPIGCIFREILKLGEFENLGDCAILEVEKNNDDLKLLSMDNAKLKNE